MLLVNGIHTLQVSDICDDIGMLFRKGKGLACILAFLSCTGLQGNDWLKHSIFSKKTRPRMSPKLTTQLKEGFSLSSITILFFPCLDFPLFPVYFFFVLSTISYFLWVFSSLFNLLAGSRALGILTDMWPAYF